MEILDNPDRIFYDERWCKAPNTHVLALGTRAVKQLLDTTDNCNEYLAKIAENLEHYSERICGELRQEFKDLLPYAWSREELHDWLQGLSEGKFFYDRRIDQVVPRDLNAYEVFANPGALLVNDSPITDTSRLPSGITSEQKRYLIQAVDKRKKDFYTLHGFEMDLLQAWANKPWLDYNDVEFKISIQSDTYMELESAYETMMGQMVLRRGKAAYAIKVQAPFSMPPNPNPTIQRQSSALGSEHPTGLNPMYFIFAFPPAIPTGINS
jgi:hypothetical protein